MGTQVFRRLFFIAFCLIFVFSLSLTASAADKYPAGPVNFLIPFGAGGSADVMGRVLAKNTEPFLGQPIVPINKPGAGGALMYTFVKDSKPDGYTVAWNSSSILTVTNIGNVKYSYDAFDYVVRIGYTSMPIAVRADKPWKTFQEFIAYAKKNPGKIKIGNAGTGSGTHLTAVAMEKATGAKFIHVPLGAKRRVPSLLGGEVEAICVPLPEVAAHAKAGKARVLAVSTAKRDPSFPDVPSMKELGYNVEMDLFRGISVPKGTPASVTKTLGEAFKKGAMQKGFQEIAKKKGFNVSIMDKDEFDKYLKAQDEYMGQIMKEAGLKK